MQEYFLQALTQEFADISLTPVEMLVYIFGAVARSNTLLMAKHISSFDRTNFTSTVILARSFFQRLLEVAAVAASLNPRSRSNSQTRSSDSKGKTKGKSKNTSSAMASQASQTSQSAKDGNIKAIEYRKDKKQPNVHIGIHYHGVMLEYALCSNCNVLIGEDKHR